MILCKRKFDFLFLFFLLAFSNLFGQDAHFSQFYANPLYLNPAFAGTENCARFNINFRDQWPQIPNNFINFSGSYDQHFDVLHGGIGALVSADLQGGNILQTYNAGAIYNFRVQVARRFNLQFALQASYMFTSFNRQKLEFASDILNNSSIYIDSILNRSYAKSQFDASFGILGFTPYLYFGLAIHHLLPLQNIIQKDKKWEPKWTAHIGGKITIFQKSRNEVKLGDVFLYPNLIFISQGDFHSLNMHYLHEGCYFNFYPFTVGAWLRHNFKNLDAVIITCGVEYKMFKIGYSYDFTLTKLERTGGAHEVSIQFIIPCNNAGMDGALQKKRKKIAPLYCPKF